MVYRFEIFMDGIGIAVVRSLQILYQCFIPNRFYESPKLKNWMCEQYMLVTYM